MLMKQNHIQISEIKQLIGDYRDSIGGDEDDESEAKDKVRLNKLDWTQLKRE